MAELLVMSRYSWSKPLTFGKFVLGLIKAPFVLVSCLYLRWEAEDLQNLLLRFWLHLSPHFFIHNLPIPGPTKSWVLFISFSLSTAKLSISAPGVESLMRGHQRLFPIICPRQSTTSQFPPPLLPPPKLRGC